MAPGKCRPDRFSSLMPRWINLANLFTFTRLALVPVIVHAILEGRNVAALQLFFAAALTDVIDGFLARNFNQATTAGAYLDPVADKCLLSGMYLAMGATGTVPWWFVAIVFGRDIYILLAVLGVMALTTIRKFPPSPWGKISTFVQIATAVTFLVQNIWQIAAFQTIAAAMLWICSAFTVWSGVHYTIRGAQTLRTH
jgi:cardiolipin synthase